MKQERCEVNKSANCAKLKRVWAVGEEVLEKAREIVEEVIQINKLTPEEIAKKAKEEKPDVILWNADLWGRKNAPIVAAMLDTGLCADCTMLEADGDNLIMYRPAQGGNITAKIKCLTKPQMATVRTKSKSSDIIVSGGKGIAETIEKLEELVIMLNAELGASRGLVDMNKIPYDDYIDVNSFCERFDKMDDDADIVVVFGGTNDYGHGDAPLGNFDDRTPDTFYGACHYLFSGLIRKYLGKSIVIMTPLHRIGEMKIPDIKVPGDYGILKEYINIIREVAEYYSLPVLDLYSSSGLQPEIKEIQDEYIPDGLHPNDRGHEIIARKLKFFLENI